MNNKFISILLVIASTYYGYSQRLSEKIGTNPTIINASAVVEIESTTKGFLPPRMISSERDNIVAPAEGLMIWCTNCGRDGELQIFNGTNWTNSMGGFPQTPLPTATDGGLLSFMSHNLGADVSAPNTTPSWRLNGAYFQWGKKPKDTNWDWFLSKPNEGGSGFAAAPTGPDLTQANNGAISNWSSAAAGNDSWYFLGADGYTKKTSSDPCPTHWRVPTSNEWASVTGTWTNVPGSIWTESATNYTSGKILNTIYLPAAGYRDDYNGSLMERGLSGNYWTSTQFNSTTANTAIQLYFSSGGAVSRIDNLRKIGCSIRCIRE